MKFSKKSVVFIVLTIILITVFFCDTRALPVQAELSGKTSSYPTVIIDAGHGGFDGGAVADDGTPEKNINLSISLKLKSELAGKGVNTVMIREDDSSVEDDGLSTIRQRKISDLHNRLNVMKNTENSVYVSIHQNYFADKRCKGAQVFYSQNFSENSSALAQYIQNSITETLQPENTRLIKPCGTSVYVIYNAVKPAVLVECGFLSNGDEAELLKSDDYQQKMAECIANGIMNYFGNAEQ